ncbi:hypothetical protein AWZ03_015004 [Drosophila navojoa]|uniref:Reverse transcriptase domain-containing protein n=1 Tax=Drosophila navojoa TaxID=7232 RepID=A0A484AQ11_DRONA|nr:hypothetical protein AWZ03_015004 [Drosophila navojoa]
MCLDYRQLNAYSIPEAYLIPRITHILVKLQQAQFISALDLQSVYWQIPITAQNTERERKMFQSALDTVIGPEIEPHAFAKEKGATSSRKSFFLGHVISGKGICIDPAKVEAIRNLPAPKNLKELRQYLVSPTAWTRCRLSKSRQKAVAIFLAIRKMGCYLDGYRLDVDHLVLKWLSSIESLTGGNLNVVADASQQAVEVEG